MSEIASCLGIRAFPCNRASWESYEPPLDPRVNGPTPNTTLARSSLSHARFPLHNPHQKAQHASTARGKQTSIGQRSRQHPPRNIRNSRQHAPLPVPLPCVRSPTKLTRLSAQNCQLDRRELSICISLIERGVNPEALAVSHASPCFFFFCFFCFFGFCVFSFLLWSRAEKIEGCQTTIKELRKGAQETKMELDARKKQQQR